jgi:pimeloyl-ACP methyl ester carboxylesterase
LLLSRVLIKSRVSGYDGAQALTQLSILQQLSILLKSGQYTGSIGTPSKIAHVGHSFGSFLSQALITTRPDLSDAAILTGLAWEPSTQGTAIESLALRIASTVSEEKWPGLDNQYLTAVDVVGNAAFFFHGESYDKQLLWYSDYVSQPLAAIELLTGSSLVTAPASFEGPVMVCNPSIRKLDSIVAYMFSGYRWRV